MTTTSVDLIEGIVTTSNTSPTQFQVVTNDFVPATSNSKIGGLSLGDPVNITLAAGVSPFVIDSKGLPVVTDSRLGSTSATDILPGQTVLLHITTFTANREIHAPPPPWMPWPFAFTRVPASVTAPPAPNFSIQSLPPFFGQTATNQVQFGTGNPSTYLDGYSSTGSITVNDNVSIRALYFGVGVTPSFTAAKVRKN